MFNVHTNIFEADCTGIVEVYLQDLMNAQHIDQKQ